MHKIKQELKKRFLQQMNLGHLIIPETKQVDFDQFSGSPSNVMTPAKLQQEKFSFDKRTSYR